MLLKIKISILILAIFSGCLPGNLPNSKNAFTSIYIVNHGWHTGLVVNKQLIPDSVWMAKNDFPKAEYLEVGWGDEEFYQAPENTVWMALKAALLPTKSVLHVVGVSESVRAYFPYNEIIKIELTEKGFKKLCTYIDYSFTLDQTGKPVAIGSGLYGNSKFYRAKDKYFITQNCNHWTAYALRTAGCPINPNHAFTAGNLLRQIRKFGKVIQKEK